ncbi:hypothetical protein N665_3789s0005 [Sinapis alba]|nr:hypothetical protein N665_3789s0005 [Sinapis alba]
MKLKNQDFNQREDICLWKRENGDFKPGFITSQTWNLIRSHSPKIPWFKGIWFPEVWNGTTRDLAGGCTDKWSQVVQVLARGLKEETLTFLMKYYLQAVAYALWYERNVRRVGEKAQPASCLIARLDKLIRNRISSLRGKAGGKRHEQAMQIWFGRR